MSQTQQKPAKKTLAGGVFSKQLGTDCLTIERRLGGDKIWCGRSCCRTDRVLGRYFDTWVQYKSAHGLKPVSGSQRMAQAVAKARKMANQKGDS